MQRLYPENEKKIIGMDKETLEQYLQTKGLYDCQYGERAKEIVRYVHGRCFSTECQAECEECRWNPIRSTLKVAEASKEQIKLPVAATFLAEAAITIVAKMDTANATVGKNYVFTSENAALPIRNFHGRDYCRCNGNGRFFLIAKNFPEEKQYMRCKKCGCYTH